jgi:hypothetical protein
MARRRYKAVFRSEGFAENVSNTENNRVRLRMFTPAANLK